MSPFGSTPRAGGTGPIPAAARLEARSFAGNRAPAPVQPPSGPVLTGGWTQWSFLELGALQSAVPCARLHARQVLWEWGLKELIEISELLVSEILTNAIQASSSLAASLAVTQVVRLWLVTDGAQVLIQVWDASPWQPQPADLGTDAEHGRGLLLVDTLAAGWGSFTVPGWPGKVVWARCRI